MLILGMYKVALNIYFFLTAQEGWIDSLSLWGGSFSHASLYNLKLDSWNTLMCWWREVLLDNILGTELWYKGLGKKFGTWLVDVASAGGTKFVYLFDDLGW